MTHRNQRSTYCKWNTVLMGQGPTHCRYESRGRSSNSQVDSLKRLKHITNILRPLRSAPADRACDVLQSMFFIVGLIAVWRTTSLLLSKQCCVRRTERKYSVCLSAFLVSKSADQNYIWYFGLVYRLCKFRFLLWWRCIGFRKNRPFAKVRKLSLLK
jgi:hypothetical protein